MEVRIFARRFIHTRGIVTGTSVTSAKPFDSIPGPTGIYNIPVIGTLLQIYPFTDVKKHKIHHLFRNLHQKYGKIVKMRRLTEDKIFLFDPDYISQAMQQEGKYPERTTMPIIEAYAKRTGRRPLSIFHGEEWQKIRSSLQHKLKHSAISGYISQQESCANDFVEWLEINSENSPDLKLAISHYVTDADAVTLFNKKLGLIREGKLSENNEDEQFLKDVKTVFQIVGKSFYTGSFFKYFKTPMYRQYEDAMTNVMIFCENRIQEQLAIDRSTYSEDNILHELINDDTLPEESLPYALSLFMYAGVETTSNAILWFLYCLAAYTDKQQNVWNEITERCPNEIDISALRHMPYIKASLKESFRCIFPTVAGSMRQMPEDVEIGGYHIPKGTLVHFGHNTVSRSEKYFENADDFIPERWISGKNTPEAQRLMSICCLPFGAGKRNCLGRRLAEQEILVAVIKILQKFSLSLDHPEDIRSMDANISYVTLVVADEPLKIRFTKRH